MKVTYTVGNIALEIDADTQVDVFQQLASFQ